MNTKKTKCVIYARVSESRTSADSMSCQAQTDKCRSYVDANDWELIGELSDHSKTGKTVEGRPGLEQAIEQACQHKAVLLCYSLSRIARSVRDLLNISDRLQNCKADFACVKEKFDTSTSSGKLIFHIFAALQEFEREQIAQRTSDAMRSHIANGRKMSSNANYGYTFDGKQMVKDRQEQNTIQRMLELRHDGYSYNQICQILIDEGHKPRGKKFYAPNVYRLIANHSQESGQ